MEILVSDFIEGLFSPPLFPSGLFASMGTDRSLDEQRQEASRQLEALRASTAARGGGSLTPEVRSCSVPRQRDNNRALLPCYYPCTLYGG